VGELGRDDEYGQPCLEDNLSDQPYWRKNDPTYGSMICLPLTAHLLPSLFEKLFSLGMGKKLPTLEYILPFLAVLGDEGGIWISILKILVSRLQIFANAFI
jgi:hypothetical protein